MSGLDEVRILALERQATLAKARVDRLYNALGAINIPNAEQFLLRNRGTRSGAGLGFDLFSDRNFHILDPTWFASWETVIFDVADTVATSLPQLGYLMAGCGVDVCGSCIHFNPVDWAAIGDWIAAGGRLWLNGEWNGCETDPITMNSFLAAIGSTVTNQQENIDPGPSCTDKYPQTPGPAALAVGNNYYIYASTGFAGGGATLVFEETGHGAGTGFTMFIEQIGDGYLLTSGDSNTFDDCLVGMPPTPTAGALAHMKIVEQFFNPEGALI